MNPDVHTLTGAYALDALSETERAAFERHLLECPDCAQEVREFAETAARLGEAVTLEPPEQLRERVLTEIAHTRQRTPDQTPPPARGRGNRRWAMRAAALAAAAAVIAAVALGVNLASTRHQLDHTQTQLASISSVLRDPDSVTSKGASSHGNAMAVVSPSQHKAVLMVSGMPPAPPDKAYQLWFIGSTGAHSAGVLQPGRNGKLEPVIAPMTPGASQVGLTMEPAGGSKQPTTKPMMSFRLA